MITENMLNLSPILPYLKSLGAFILIGVIAFLIHNGYIFKSFSKHDNSIIDKFLSKYPDVSPEFMKKGIKEQSIENNQEIHEINKRFDKNDKDIEELKNTLNKVIEILDKMQEEK